MAEKAEIRGASFRVRAQRDGYECEIGLEADTVNDALQRGKALLQYLAGEEEWEPVSTQVPIPGGSEELPETMICPEHGQRMKLREKHGDRWYSHKYFTPEGEEEWCRSEVT